jgi:hypothetical protein
MTTATDTLVDRTTIKRLFALLGRADVITRGARLAFYSAGVGRTVTSTNELTAAEIGSLIVILKSVTGEDPPLQQEPT